MSDPIIQTIKSFRDLPHNWNGYGAEPLSSRLIEKAIEVYETIKPLYDWQVVPAKNAIQFEVHTGCFDVEVYIADVVDVDDEPF